MKRAFAVILATAAVAGCQPGVPSPARPLPPLDPLPPASPTTAPSTQPAVTPQPAPATQPARVEQPAPRPQPPVHPTPAIPKTPPLAVVKSVEVSRDQVVDLVMESYGLDMLLRVVQVEMARREAHDQGLTVTPADVEKEKQLTLQRLFQEGNQRTLDQIAQLEAAKQFEKAQTLREQMEKDNQSLLQQLLTKQQITQRMFDLQMESQAHLRKVVEKISQNKITEEHVYKAFLTLYGENVRVKFIQCANLAEIAEVQHRLDAGEPFETVARQLSRNAATAGLGGELPPFSRETPRIPEVFKDAAFNLKNPGDVSYPVQADNAYHLIKLVERIAPKAVKFEDVKDSVRDRLYERLIEEEMKLLRDRLGKIALNSLQISDPVLAKQYDNRLRQRENEIRDREQINRELQREREEAAARLMNAEPATQPATAPATAPALAPQTNPTPGELRPPATESGSDTPDQPPASAPATQP